MVRRVIDSGTSKVLVYGRTPGKTNDYVMEMTGKGWDISACSSPDELLHHCDVIMTTTSSRTPILGTTVSNETESLGCKLIVCIGSDAPGKRELSEGLLRSSLVGSRIADSKEQSLERGEFQCLKGTALEGSIVSIGKVIKEGMSILAPTHGKVAVVDSSGVAIQDCAVAQMVCQAMMDESRYR
jgi:ornithine cyclodeaminase